MIYVCHNLAAKTIQGKDCIAKSKKDKKGAECIDMFICVCTPRRFIS